MKSVIGLLNFERCLRARRGLQGQRELFTDEQRVFSRQAYRLSYRFGLIALSASFRPSSTQLLSIFNLFLRSLLRTFGPGCSISEDMSPLVMDHQKRRKSALGCFTCKYVPGATYIDFEWSRESTGT